MRALTCCLGLALIVAVPGATGCASTQGRTMADGKSERIVTNREYVAYVESVARRRGVEVQWVNPPKVRKPAEDDRD